MPDIDWSAAQLPAEEERLANGLSVIIHVEPKSPIAAVYVGYKAGSRYEPKAKAGLAHLCEHLMFSGTKRNPASYFAAFEQAGALWMNAFVREDYSAYFATVPNTALDFALSMEADRMAALVEALDDDKVDRQRDVVISELRQREGQPYGSAARILAELANPPGHPYAHLPDGLIAELEEISAGDVREWIAARHSPARATLVVAGDVEPGRIIERARHHFGALAASSVVAEPVFTTAEPAVETRRQLELAVNRGRVCIAWNGPAVIAPDVPAIEVACEILAGTKSSRLRHRMIQAEQLATDIMCEVRPRELGILILLCITVRNGVPLDKIQALARCEIERLSREGPVPRELEVARLRLFGKMVRGFERVGGPQSKSDVLGLASIVGGTVESHQRRLALLAKMQPEDVAAASRWLTSLNAVLEIYPSTGNEH